MGKQQQTYTYFAVLIIIGLLMFTLMGKADKLEPDSPPAPSMHSLDEGYDAIINSSQSGLLFIKFDGVNGEATERYHRDWSNMLSFNHGMYQPGLGGGATGGIRRRGDVIMDDIVCTKVLDKASPKIADAVCKGRVFRRVEIELMTFTMNAGQVIYYRYELRDVMVTSYTISGNSDGENRPVEEFSLNCDEIKVIYTELDDKGKQKGDTIFEWKAEKY